jgi:hypothetical protein
MPPSARGTGGNELALLRSENSALRARLTSASVVLPPALEPAEKLTVARANDLAVAWAAAAKEARAAAVVIEAKAKEAAALAKEVANAEKKETARRLEEEKLKEKVMQDAAAPESGQDTQESDCAAQAQAAVAEKAQADDAAKAQAEREREANARAERQKMEEEKKAARGRVAAAEKAQADRTTEKTRLKREREQKEAAERAATAARAAALERERQQLAKQQMDEAHRKAAELALAAQALVLEAAEATCPTKLRSKTGPEWATHCGGPAMLDLLEDTDLVDAQYLIALGQHGGVLPRWQELPEPAKLNAATAWRLHCWGGSYCLPVLVLSHCPCARCEPTASSLPVRLHCCVGSLGFVAAHSVRSSCARPGWMDAEHPDRFGTRQMSRLALWRTKRTASSAMRPPAAPPLCRRQPAAARAHPRSDAHPSQELWRPRHHRRLH